MLTLHKDTLHIDWPFGVKENITITEDEQVSIFKYFIAISGGSGYPIPGIPEPDRNYFVIPELDRNLSDQDRNRIGTGLWTGGYPECQKGTIFTQNMATFEKKSTFNFSKYPLEIFLKFSCP